MIARIVEKDMDERQLRNYRNISQPGGARKISAPTLPGCSGSSP